MVELLVVMSIIIVLAGASIAGLGSAFGGGKSKDTYFRLAGLLEQARQYAVSKNTYVWVVFYPKTGSVDGDELSVAVLASSDGTKYDSSNATISSGASDSIQWTGSVPDQSSTFLQLVTKVQTFSKIKLKEAGEVTDLTSLKALEAPPVITSSNSLKKDAAFQIAQPGVGVQTFSYGLVFSPSGTVRTGDAPIDMIEIGLVPMKGSTEIAKNAAVFRINGLTGQTRMYRN